MPLQPNSMLGPYRIVEMIGEGGMGAVYRATDTRLGRDVAVKILTAVTLDRDRLQRFAQEARTTGMLNHPNLLTVYDVGNASGTPFLVSELLQGETLRERIDRGAIPPRKAVEIALQMAQGLAAAHEKGVVHRDLKPDNLFLTREGRVKILDFGIAKLTGRAADGPVMEVAATEPGIVLGTVGYMAPEQVRGEGVDQRADIFAFGTIVYEMLTATQPFRRGSAVETLTAILREEPPELVDVVPNIPPALDRLTRRCLEKDREMRFQTARDLAFNLETLSTIHTSAPLGAAPAPQPRTPTSTTPMSAAASGASTVIREAVRSGTRARAPLPPVKVKRTVSPLLVVLLLIAAAAGAAWSGWKFAKRDTAAKPEPEYHRITFRRGEVRSARFSPDGETIVYSAAWDGNPAEIFTANRKTPESRPLGIVDADVLAVSRSTELAILLRRDRLTNAGTLARVPLAGGVPREVADGVLQADWSPDGASLAMLRVLAGKYRVEYPAGSVLYESPRQIRDLRLSPDGKRLAFIEPRGGRFDLVVIENGKPAAVARGWSRGVSGIAWRPDGEEIWLTGTDNAAPPSLYSVTLAGETRFVSRLTGSMKLFDISPAGNALMSNGTWRAALMWQTPGESGERDFSWFDWSMLADMSPDGRTILFSETREGGGDRSAIYVRRADQPVPVRIGEGFGDAISPDGQWVLAHDSGRLVVVPTGAGEPRQLKVAGAFDFGAVWLPDSRRFVIGGAAPKRGYQLWVIDTLDESARAITPENIWGESFRAFAVSPDGQRVAGMTPQRSIAIYDAGGAADPVAVTGAEAGEVPLSFSADGAALYVVRASGVPPQIFRIDLATGARTPWKQFALADPSGVYKTAPVVMTRDGSAYAFNALRILSELYVAENLR